MLENQLESSRKRIETVVELESEMRKYRQQLEELSKVTGLEANSSPRFEFGRISF